MDLSSANTTNVRRRAYEPNTRPRAADEQALVERAQRGERDAFEELVRVHAAGLHAVVARLCATREEAEEVTQEAFLRAWRGIRGFQGDSQLFTWLYRIGVNEAKRRIDRHARDDAETLDARSERDAADRRATPDVRAEQNDLRGRSLSSPMRQFGREFSEQPLRCRAC